MVRAAKWYPAGVALSGEPIVLDDGTPGPMYVMKGATGIEAPPWTVSVAQSPGVRSASFDRAVPQVRSIKLPIHLRGSTRAELRRVKADLIRAINPEAGPGTLVLSDGFGEDSGTERSITAVYNGGLEGDESAMRIGDRQAYWDFTIEFLGLDVWYSLEPTVATWTGRPGVPFFPRKFPYALAPYGVITGIPLELDGDTQSWPSYTLAGPWSRARFTRDATGESWEIVRGQDYLTETLTMNTDPSLSLGPRTLDGQSRYSWLRFQSDLFPLSPGDTVSVEADSVTSETLLTLTVVPAWLTAS